MSVCELETLQLVAKGMTYKQIALERGRSASTVRTQVHFAIRRLGAVDGTTAVLACVAAGWISLDDGSQPVSGSLLALTRLVGELVDAVRDRRQRGLTAGQRAYLSAFEEHLYARGEDRAGSRAQMDQAAAGLLEEAGVVPRGRADRTHDLVDVLARAMARAA